MENVTTDPMIEIRYRIPLSKQETKYRTNVFPKKIFPQLSFNHEGFISILITITGVNK